MRKLLFLTYFLFSICILTYSQLPIGLPYVKNYTPKDYIAHYQNWDMMQSKSGVLYFSNGEGILTFDGATWQLFEHDSINTPRAIFKSKSGNIYIGGNYFFGKLSVDSVGSLDYTSLLSLIDTQYRNFKVVWDINEIDDTLVLRTDKDILIIYDDVNILKKPQRAFYRVLINSKNELYACEARTIQKFKNGIFTEIRSDSLIFGIFEKNDSTFILTSDSKIYHINQNSKLDYYSDFNFQLRGLIVSETKVYKNKYLLISTYNAGLYITDLKGNLLYIFDKTTGLNTNTIYFAKSDFDGNLWVGSNSGISKIELENNIKVIDQRYTIDITNPMKVFYFNNKIYTCAGYTFFEIDFSSGRTIMTEIPRAGGQIWDAVSIGKELYLAANPRFHRIDTKNNLAVKNYGVNDNIWDIERVPYDTNKFLVGTYSGIYVYNYNGDSLKFVKKIPDFEKQARTMKFDSKGNFWVGRSSEGVYKIKLTDSFTIQKIDFYNDKNGLFSTNTIKFFEWKDKFLISTYKTLFEYDYQKDSIYEFHIITDNFDYSGKKILQLIGIDANENFWFEYHNDLFQAFIFTLTFKNGKFREIYKTPRRLFNTTVSDLVSIDSDKVFLACPDHYAIVTLDSTYNIFSSFRVLVRKVTLIDNDSIVFGGYSMDSDSIIFEGQKQKLILKFKNRNIRIYFAAPFNTEPQGTLYRYRLDNYEKNWSAWTTETKKDYTNLPPGNYIFYVEAKNIYGQLSELEKFHIYISYPWYRTIYAYLAYIFILGLILLGIIKIFTYRLKRRNEKLEELVNERTKEIQLKNAELEQSKEEIMAQAEELQLANQELEKLSVIVRETDNAVFLTDKDGNFIWVNNAFSKIFGYTLEELVSSISPNIIGGNTDDHIKEQVHKCLNEKVTVKYELKLKNKSGNEIWVHTTLTPLLDDENEIISLVAVDADITPLKDAERLITEQKEQITASIIYARTIQSNILPTKQEIEEYFDNFIIYNPKDIVSGDFYWISNLFRTVQGRLTHATELNKKFEIGNTLFFAVVDCTGHGVPGAFMSLISNHLLSEIINEQRFASPKEILEQMDSNLSKALKRSNSKNFDGMVISLCRFDKIINDQHVQVRVTYSGAKQHISYFKNSSKQIFKIRGAARQIGFVLNQDIHFEEHVFYLDNNDILFMYTDGLKDLNNPQRVSFGFNHILSILQKNIDNPIEKIGEILKFEMDNWLGPNLQRDDITFIGLKIK